MLEPVVDLLRASRRVGATQPNSARRALLEHERTLARVESGDAEGAWLEMRGHLANAAGDIQAAIREGMLEAGEESI